MLKPKYRVTAYNFDRIWYMHNLARFCASHLKMFALLRCHVTCASMVLVRFGQVLVLFFLTTSGSSSFFFYEFWVVVRTYVLLKKAFVGQCCNRNGLGLSIENQKEAQLWGDQVVAKIFCAI